MVQCNRRQEPLANMGRLVSRFKTNPPPHIARLVQQMLQEAKDICGVYPVFISAIAPRVIAAIV